MMDLPTLKDWAAVFATTIGLGSFMFNVVTRHFDRRMALRGTYDRRIDSLKDAVDAHANRLERIEGQHCERRIEAQGEIINLNTTRINRLEIRMESVATRSDVAQVDKAITALGGQVEVVVERLKPLAAIAERLQDFLIAQSQVAPREHHP